MPPIPFARRPLIEELEPRLLFSADFAPGIVDALAPQTEQRLIGSDGEFANAADSQQAQHARLEVVFIDLRVQGYDKILADIQERNTDGHSIEVVLLDAERDGVAQIGEFLSQRQGIDALHLISHGSAGTVELGSGQLNFDSLRANASAIKQWGSALSEDADLLIYGCDLASTADGRSLVDALGSLTGADVAASDDKTGTAELGGDWDLEYASGAIETRVAVSAALRQSWSSVLAITENGVATSTQTDNATSLVWSHTVEAGTNRALFVELAIDGLGAGVTGVAYGGEALTQVGRAGGNHAVEIWVLTNPAVGTADIVASFGGSTAAAGGATAFNGVDQSAPVGAFAGATGTGTESSVAVASATGDRVIDVQYWKETGANIAGTGQTSLWSASAASMLGGSTVEAGAASVTMTGTSGVSSQWEIGAVSIRAAAAGTAVDLAPAAADDTAGGNEDATIAGNVLANDTDAEGDTLTATLVSGPAHGSLTLNADGSFSYTPDADWNGSDGFQYLAGDGSTGLVHYWALEGDGADAVGGADGTPTNGPVAASGRDGSALQFDGVDDYVALPDIGYTNEFSLTFHFKVDDNSGTGLQYFYSHGMVGENNSIHVSLAEASWSDAAVRNHLVTTVWDSNDLASDQVNADVGSLIGDGQWHLYTLTAKSGVGTQVYVDGVLQGSLATGGDAIDPAGNAVFGARSDLAADRFLNAGSALDSAALYDRALDTAEIAGLATTSPQATVALTVDPVNDAPVLDSTRSPVLASQDEDSGAPSGAAGTPISALVDFAVPSGQIDNVVDPDADALPGIAITAADTANGSWWYTTDNGDTWNALGAVSEDGARLLAADAGTRLYFQPNADYGGTLANAITFRAWDLSSGTNGGTANLTSTIADQFTAAAYSNNDGATNWTSAWTETDDDGSATAGNIRIESGKLYLDNQDGGGIESIQRAFSASGASSATLTFTYDGHAFSGTDSFAFDVSNDGGATWTRLEHVVFVAAPGTDFSGSRSFNLQEHLALTGDMVLRFGITAGLAGPGQHVNFDNVRISLAGGATGGGSAFSSATDTASLSVNPVSDAPAGTNGTISATEDTNYIFTLADFGFSDIDGDAFDRVWFDTLPGQGTLNWNGSPFAAGNFVTASDIAAGQLAYVPPANANGAAYASFAFRVQDDGGTANGGANLDSTPNTLTIDLAAVNDAPVNTLAGAGAAIPEDTTVQLLDAVAIADVDGGSGSYTVALSVTPAAGTLSAASSGGVTVSGSGTSSLILAGTLSSINAYFAAPETAPFFVPVADYNGPVSVTVVTSDNGNAGSGGALTDSDTASGTIAPVADIADDSATTDEDTPVTFAPLVNDSFENAGRAITHIDGTAVAAGESVAVTGGSATLNADGTLTYAPTANYFGTPSFTYTVASGGTTETATVGVAVNAINDPPVFGNLNGAPTHTEGGSAVVLDADVSIFDAELSNADSFDGATLMLARRDGASADDALAFDGTNVATSGANVLVGGVAVGTFTFTGGEMTIVFGADATQARVDTVLRNIVYWNWSEAPPASVQIDWRFSDGNAGAQGAGGALAATGSTAVAIAPVNDAPVITSNGGGDSAAISLAENTVAVATMTRTDVDGGAPIYSIGGTDAALFAINSATGELTFTAAPDFEVPTDSNGDNVYEVTVEVGDGAGGTDSQALTVTVTDVDEFDVGAIADTDATINAVDENAANGTVVGITAFASDADATTNAIAYSLDDTAGGRFTIDATTGVVTVADGSLLDYETATSHAIALRATSSDGSHSVSTLTVNVAPVNDNAPVITSDGGGATTTLNVAENVAAVTTVTASDADLPAQTLTYAIVGGADAGLFTIDVGTGALRFSLPPDFESPTDAGLDNAYEVIVEVSDGTFGDAQTLAVTVTPANDNAPVSAPAILVPIAEDSGVRLITQAELLAGASDADGDSLTAAGLAIGSGGGTLTDNGDGTWDYTPAADDDNAVSFSYTVTDGSLTASGSATLDIAPVNDAPVVAVNTLSLLEGETVVLGSANLNAGDVEQGPAQLTYTVGNVAHGQFEWVAAPGTAIASFSQADIDAGLVAFAHDAGDFAPAYDVTVSDGALTDGPRAATINFTAVAEGISVSPASGPSTTEAGSGVSFGVALDSQPFSDVTIFIASGNPAEGTASLSSLTFTATNWNIAQKVTVTGVDDAVDDGDRNYAVQLQAAVSADRNYAGLDPADVALSNLDDDTAGILVTSPGRLITDESGGSDTFSVVLTSQPLADVVIRFDSSNAAEGVLSNNSLVFTAGDWNIPRTVTATGVSDTLDDGNVAYQAVAAPAASADPLYDGLIAGAVDIANLNATDPVPTDLSAARNIEPDAATPQPDPATVPETRDNAAADEPEPTATINDLPRATRNPDTGDNRADRIEAASSNRPKPAAPRFAPDELLQREVLTDPTTQGDLLLRLLDIIQAGYVMDGADGRSTDSAIRVDIAQDDSFQVEILSQDTRIAAVSLSVGAVWWALRAGGLFTSLLTSLPAWRTFDVLPVLSRDEDEDDAWGLGDDPEDAGANTGNNAEALPV